MSTFLTKSPTNISRSDIAKMQSRLKSLASRAKSLTEKSDEIVNTVVRSTEVCGATFVAGAINGRYGEYAPGGVPLELGVAGALHGLALLGVGGQNSHHLRNFGDGFAAAYLYNVGRDVGTKMAVKAGDAEEVDE